MCRFSSVAPQVSSESRARNRPVNVLNLPEITNPPDTPLSAWADTLGDERPRLDAAAEVGDPLPEQLRTPSELPAWKPYRPRVVPPGPKSPPLRGLARKLGMGTEYQNACVVFLVEFVHEHGQVANADLVNAARTAGYGEYTVRRAKRRVPFVRTRPHFGSDCFYSLPTDDEDSDP